MRLTILLLALLCAVQTPLRAELVTLLGKKSLWKYNDTGTDLGTTWRAGAFDDSGWASGIGWLGYGDLGFSTELSYGPDANNKYPTYYFRHAFTLTGTAAQYTRLLVNLKRDDGAVVYLNGTELFRSNMPAGAIGYTSLAIATVDGANEETYYAFDLPSSLLVNGTNVFAVEVHQRNGTSSDLRFDMEVIGVRTGPQTYSGDITSGSYWAYFDQGSLPGATWHQSTFNHSTWRLGRAPLGYDDAILNTTVSYGPDANNKYRTTYFVLYFTVADASAISSMDLGVMVDDGAVVYINGTEIARNNMPGGAVAYNTLASTAKGGTDETAWNAYNITNTSMLVNGLNVLAVEVHQASNNSSDKVFDAQLTLNTSGGGGPTCDPGADTHVGTFVSVDPAGRDAQLKIPCTHRYQVLRRQGEAHTSGGGSFGSTVDFTGFIPKTGSSTSGYLGVNHETSPGGVSMLEVDYDFTTHLWGVSTSRAVSFASVSQTYRNCSGGVTPWGTFITSEEGQTTTTYASGDNAGYEIYGWQVEIDPATAAVIDHAADANTTPDKLWAMGTMDHENIVVAVDEVTAYYGADNGTYGYVYKFVANTPRDLSQGTLYVLTTPSRNAAATTGTWVSVPNTTIAQRNTTPALSDGLNATNFNGVEDVEIAPDGRIYFTAKGTGRVYRFTDNGATVSNLETIVGPSSASYPIAHAGGTTNVSWGSGNDNLAFDNQGNLWVLQDGGNDYIWVVEPTHTQASPRVKIFGNIPAGAEPTGLTFSPDGAFGFMSIQSPTGSNAANQTDAAGFTFNNNTNFTLVFGRSEVLGDEASYGLFPIEDFHVQVTPLAGTQAHVQWTTGQEINTSHFEVERSINGLTYTTLGSQPAAGYAQTRQQYSLVDPATPRNQVVYYRVRAHDMDGSHTLSHTVTLRLDDKLGIYFLPNPWVSRAQLKLTLPLQMNVRLELRDMQGRRVALLQPTHSLLPGEHSYTLDRDALNLQPGIYFLTAQMGAEQKAVKVMVQ